MNSEEDMSGAVDLFKAFMRAAGNALIYIGIILGGLAAGYRV